MGKGVLLQKKVLITIFAFRNVFSIRDKVPSSGGFGGILYSDRKFRFTPSENRDFRKKVGKDVFFGNAEQRSFKALILGLSKNRSKSQLLVVTCVNGGKHLNWVILNIISIITFLSRT